MNLIFLEGHRNYDNASLFASLFRGFAGQCKEYVSRITEIINNENLGVEEYPAQQTFALSENQKGVGTLSLDNNRTRYIVENIDRLINAIIVDDNRKVSQKRAMQNLKKHLKYYAKRKIMLKKN